MEETGFEELDWLLGINLMGVINGTKAFLPHLIRSGDGHLVNISSVFGLVAPAYQSAYCTAKFGVRGFTEVLAAGDADRRATRERPLRSPRAG